MIPLARNSKAALSASNQWKPSSQEEKDESDHGTRSLSVELLNLVLWQRDRSEVSPFKSYSRVIMVFIDAKTT